MKLFHVDASIRHEGSISRELAAIFREQWLEAHPEGTVTHRDLAADPLPHLTGPEFEAAMTPPDRRTDEQREKLALQRRIVDEVLDADAYLIATPIYNWSAPSSLKAWVDRLMMDRALPEKLAGRPAVIVMAKGGAYGPGTPKEGWDFAEPWLRRVFGEQIGLDLEVVAAELTLADVNPAMSHLKDVARESLATARKAAARHGGELGRKLAAA
jgi:FMN-dependent NADH-azoreductase